MRKKATVKERKEGKLWDDIRALYDKLLYWYYEQENPKEARPFALRLERLLKKASPHHETILGEECWSLVYELKGNYKKAIRYRENEIRLIERLQELARGKPNGQVVLRRYDYADLCDRLELLAVLYHRAGNLDKAVSVLQECEELSRRSKIAFDGEDILQAYLDEKTKREAAKKKRRKAKKPRP
jgi:tetratricopeptide (TPR) repeat protein